MTVGYFAPEAQAKTGVADYASDLLFELRHHARVERDAPDPDLALYHLGNNGLHRAIYERAMRVPGVVILHDAVLHHFYLGALNRETYLEEFTYNYGVWEIGLAEQLWRERAISGTDARYFEKPMLKRVGECSRAVVVHNAEARDRLLHHAPHANVIEIPHLYSPPPVALADPARTRAKLGLPPDAYVFAVFGYLRESKRITLILDAVQRVRERCPRAQLLLAGDFASSDLERAVRPLLTGPGVHYLPYLSERELWNVASAVDCCVNLRHPSAGETSGIGVRLMGLGKPVIFSDGRELSALPSDSCVRVSAGVEEKTELLQYMEMLIGLPHVGRAIGEKAAQHIREHHLASRVARQFYDVLCGLRPALVC